MYFPCALSSTCQVSTYARLLRVRFRDGPQDRIDDREAPREAGSGGIGSPIHIVTIPAALNSRVTPSTRRRYSAFQLGLPSGPTVRPRGHARHEVVGVVGAEREHDDVRAQLRDHLAEAREPVVEVGACQAGRETALDAATSSACRPERRSIASPGTCASESPPTQTLNGRVGVERTACSGVGGAAFGRLGASRGEAIVRRDRRRGEVHRRVDPVLCLTADRRPAARGVASSGGGTADATSGRVTSSARSRRAPSGWVCAVLRIPSAFEQRCEREREGADDDAAAGGCRGEFHPQKRK